MSDKKPIKSAHCYIKQSAKLFSWKTFQAKFKKQHSEFSTADNEFAVGQFFSTKKITWTIQHILPFFCTEFSNKDVMCRVYDAIAIALRNMRDFMYSVSRRLVEQRLANIFRAFTLAFRARRSADSKLTMNPTFSRVIIPCVAAGKKRRAILSAKVVLRIKRKGGDREVRARTPEETGGARRGECGIYGKS